MVGAADHIVFLACLQAGGVPAFVRIIMINQKKRYVVSQVLDPSCTAQLLLNLKVSNLHMAYVSMPWRDKPGRSNASHYDQQNQRRPEALLSEQMQVTVERKWCTGRPTLACLGSSLVLQPSRCLGD